MEEIRSIEMNHLQDSTELCVTLADGKYHYFNLSSTENGLFINKNEEGTEWEIHKNGLKENF